MTIFRLPLARQSRSMAGLTSLRETTGGALIICTCAGKFRLRYTLTAGGTAWWSHCTKPATQTRGASRSMAIICGGAIRTVRVATRTVIMWRGRSWERKSNPSTNVRKLWRRLGARAIGRSTCLSTTGLSVICIGTTEDTQSTTPSDSPPCDRYLLSRCTYNRGFSQLNVCVSSLFINVCVCVPATILIIFRYCHLSTIEY